MTDMKIPKMGMSTVEVDVIKWHVAVGDKVQAGQVLVEIESEKATMEMEAEVSGTITEILVPEGDITTVGTVVCRIEPTA
jgi:pyruvate/2-oxoglutarate dehydrogenase complex dihydrolipoamide acyltransferase (E2) component